MRWFMVLATLLIVIVMISVIVSVGFKAMEVSREFEAEALVKIDRELVNSISLQMRNSPAIQLRTNHAGSWRLESPIQGPANAKNTLLVRESIFDMQIRSKISPGDKDMPTDEQIGRDQPRATLELSDLSGNKIKFSILNFIPRRKETYVTVEGDENVYCVSPDPFNTIQLTLEDFRSDKLIELSKADMLMIQSIEAMGQSEFTLKRGDMEKWAISGAKYGNKPYPARNEAVKSMLDSIAAIEVSSVSSEAITDLERFGFGDPWQSFKIKFEPLSGRSDIDIAISAHAGTMFASLDGQLWLLQLRSDSGRDTIREFWSMVQRNIFAFDEQDIISISISTADSKSKLWKFSRDSGGWSGPEGPVKTDLINNAARQICSIQFESVIDSYMRLSGFGLENPQYIISVTLSNGDTHSLLTGSKSPAAGRIYVKTDSDDSVYTVNGAIIDQIIAMAKPTAIISHEPDATVPAAASE